MQTSCSFTERCSGIPSCVAEIKTPCPLRLAVSLPPGLPFTLNCALALDRSPAQTEFCKPALCSIKGNVPGRKHRERTGGRFQSAGAEQGDLLTAARVAKSPWQRASGSLLHHHPLHSHSLHEDKGTRVPPEGFDTNTRAVFSTKCLNFWSILEFCHSLSDFFEISRNELNCR